MNYGLSFNLRVLTSQNVSLAQITAFSLLTKGVSLASSYLTQGFISHEKTRHVFSHVIGGVVSYGVSRLSSIRSWALEPLSPLVVCATTLTVYLCSIRSASSSSTKAPEATPEHDKAKEIPPTQSHLEKQLGDALEENKRLQTQIETLRQQLEQHKKPLKETNTDYKKLETAEKLKADLESKSATRDQKSSDTHDAELTSLDSQLKAAGDKYQTLKGEFDALEKKLRDSQSESKKNLDDEQKANAQLKSTQSAQEGKIADLGKELKKVKEENERLKKEAADLVDKLRAQKETDAKLQKAFDDLETSLTLKLADFEQSQKTAQAHLADRDSLARQLQAKDVAHSALKQKYDEQKEKYKDYTQLKNAYSEFKGKLDTAEKEAESLRKQLQAAKDTRPAESAPSSSPLERIDLNASEAEIRGHLKTIGDLKALRMRLNTFESQLKQKERELDALEQTLDKRENPKASSQPANKPAPLPPHVRSAVASAMNTCHPKDISDVTATLVTSTNRSISREKERPTSEAKPISVPKKPFSKITAAVPPRAQNEPVSAFYKNLPNEVDNVKPNDDTVKLATSSPTGSPNRSISALKQRPTEKEPVAPSQNLDPVFSRLEKMVNEKQANIEKVRNSPSLKPSNIGGATSGLNQWIEILLAFNGLDKPSDAYPKNPDERKWNGIELCAIVGLFRPDLVDWKTLDPTKLEDNIRLGIKMFAQASGMKAEYLVDPEDYGLEKLSMLTFYGQVQKELDPNKEVLSKIFKLSGLNITFPKAAEVETRGLRRT